VEVSKSRSDKEQPPQNFGEAAGKHNKETGAKLCPGFQRQVRPYANICSGFQRQRRENHPEKAEDGEKGGQLTTFSGKTVN
jgi:hypothetical protein